jgi:hypothetical protein
VQELTRRRLLDRKIVQYLIEGKGHRFIKQQLGIGSGRLEKVKQLAEQHGYLSGCPLPAYPEALFADRSDGRTQQRSDTDRLLGEQVGFIEERLNAGWSPITVWEELPIRVTRSSFYRFLERHELMKLVRGAKALRVVPEIVHAPGEALILDWGKLCTVLDPIRALKRTLWVLVGVLGFSRYLMARLVWTNDVPTTLAAIEVMLREIQGVPHRATSDNPKCFCLEASRYEPLLNPAFERFAAHYAFSIECLPPADPQKKGKIERMVPYVRRLYEAHGAFISLEESQAYLDRKLALANQRVHGTTRRKPIEDLVLEREHLRASPATAYEIEDTATATVRQDGHVRFANRYYSLEERFIGEEVFVLGGRERLAIYHRGKLIETHARLTDPHRSKQTKPEHLKPWERALADDSVYRRRARQLGPAAEQLIVILLAQGHGFIDTRKVWGILSLDKTYAPAAIDAACAQAIAMNSYSYRTVLGLLQCEQRKAARLTPPESKASHKFARDLSVYSESLALFPVDPPQGE